MFVSSFAYKRLMWILVMAAPAVAAAQSGASTVGWEYPVAGPFPGDQTRPAAAVSAAGGYAVWEDNSITTIGDRIRAQQLDSNLQPTGSNFLVSAVWKSKTAGNQEKPQIALTSGGGAFVVWQGGVGKAQSQQVYARIIGTNGLPTKSDLRVSRDRRHNQTDAQVATLANGNVVVVWCSDGQDGSRKGIFARLFAPATGKALGTEFLVNQWTANNQRNPAVAPLANGGFAVAWISELQRTDSSVDTYVRLFDGSGLPASGEILVNTDVIHLCANPAMASTADGFMVAWSQNSDMGLTIGSTNGVDVSVVGTTKSLSGWDVYGRIYDNSGTPANGAFRLNQFVYGDQAGPKLAAVNGHYMAVWTSMSQRDDQASVIDPWEGVFGQSFDSSGTPAEDADLHVNSTTISRQIQPVVVSDGASRFLVVWSSIGSQLGAPGYGTFDIYGQQYQQ